MRSSSPHTPSLRRHKPSAQGVVAAGWCRSLINKRVGRVLRVFRWGVGEELVPETVHRALQAVGGLAKGRSPARESAPVGPVPDEHVEAVLPLVLAPVAAM